MDLVGHISHLIIDRPVTALIVVPALTYAGWFLFRYIALLSLQAWLLVCSRRRALQAVGRVIDHRGPREGKGVWLTTPIERPRDYWRGVANSRTLAIANLKGGVGKTTLAANLGAYLAKEWQQRVLLIDLDFQGSLSSMAFPGKDSLPNTHQSSLATRLISGDLARSISCSSLKRSISKPATTAQSRLQLVTAYYRCAGRQSHDDRMAASMPPFQAARSAPRRD
jgi:hypothetical protein